MTSTAPSGAGRLRIVVGKPGNLDQAKSVNHPDKAKAAFAALIAKVGNVQATGN